jgi:hypothetical protein
MSRRLVTYVHLDGQVYGPADEVPDEVAERITNPDAWEPETQEVKPADQPAKPAARRTRTAKG